MLAAQLERIAPLYCRMCGACTGRCRKGLPVSDMVRYLSYAEGYGQFALGRENFLRLPEELQAVRCADCDDCLVSTFVHNYVEVAIGALGLIHVTVRDEHGTMLDYFRIED